jgi:hypothetical protein
VVNGAPLVREFYAQKIKFLKENASILIKAAEKLTIDDEEGLHQLEQLERETFNAIFGSGNVGQYMNDRFRYLYVGTTSPEPRDDRSLTQHSLMNQLLWMRLGEPRKAMKLTMTAYKTARQRIADLTAGPKAPPAWIKEVQATEKQALTEFGRHKKTYVAALKNDDKNAAPGSDGVPVTVKRLVVAYQRIVDLPDDEINRSA